MNMHQVEVDNEVFSFVKARAEPLVDTFNSALRRLLPLGEITKVPRAGTPLSVPSLPKGTPEALRQILEVVLLVGTSAHTRSQATKLVAERHGVFPQTVVDKYGRQLGLTAGQFDTLLDQQGLADLRTLLKSKFPTHAKLVNDLLGQA
jgi:negative regulator of replication initiation